MCVIDAETMVDWDEAKLEQVVQQKHSEAEAKKPKTDIVSYSRSLFTDFNTVVTRHFLLDSVCKR